MGFNKFSTNGSELIFSGSGINPGYVQPFDFNADPVNPKGVLLASLCNTVNFINSAYFRIEDFGAAFRYVFTQNFQCKIIFSGIFASTNTVNRPLVGVKNFDTNIFIPQFRLSPFTTGSDFIILNDIITDFASGVSTGMYLSAVKDFEVFLSSDEVVPPNQLSIFEDNTTAFLGYQLQIFKV